MTLQMRIYVAGYEAALLIMIVTTVIILHLGSAQNHFRYI